MILLMAQIDESGRERPRAMMVRRGVERRPVVLVTAALLFIAVFLARQSSGDAEAGIALLYVLPVALTALELGLVAGVAAAGFAMGLLGIWVATTEAELGAVGLRPARLSSSREAGSPGGSASACAWRSAARSGSSSPGSSLAGSATQTTSRRRWPATPVASPS